MSGAVPICCLLTFTYVGLHTTWNDKFFDKNMVYEKIQSVVIFSQQFAAVHVHFVKKLAFLNVEV